jgi:hypothetical protein
VRVLVISGAAVAIRALRRAGIDLAFERVDTPEAMGTALAEGTWDLVIAGYSMPRFNGLSARDGQLRIARTVTSLRSVNLMAFALGEIENSRVGCGLHSIVAHVSSVMSGFARAFGDKWR